MAKVAVAVRLEAEVRDEFQRWALEDRRSLGNYLEALFVQERERRLSGEVTLAMVMQKLDRILECVQPKPKRKEDREMSKMLALDLQGVMDAAHWEAWIVHLLRCGLRMNEYTAGKHLHKFLEIDRAGYDGNVLVDRLIEDGAKAVYIPYDWLKSEKG